MARSVLVLLFALIFASCAGTTGGSSSPTSPPTSSTTSVTLSWDPSASGAVTGYKIYSGRSSGQYDNSYTVGNVQTYTVRNLGPGTYYFACTAYDASGQESYFSNEVHTTLF